MNRRNHSNHWLQFKLLVRFIITGQYFVELRDLVDQSRYAPITRNS